MERKALELLWLSSFPAFWLPGLIFLDRDGKREGFLPMRISIIRRIGDDV
jgi:hypothetical protein